MKQRKIVFILAEIIFSLCVLLFLSAYVNNLVDSLKSNVNNPHELFILLRKLTVQIIGVFVSGILSTLILMHLDKLSKSKRTEK